MSFDKITDKLRLCRMTTEDLVNRAQQLEQDKADLELAVHTSLANLNDEISGLKKDNAEMMELIIKLNQYAHRNWGDSFITNTVNQADALIARMEGK